MTPTRRKRLQQKNQLQIDKQKRRGSIYGFRNKQINNYNQSLKQRLKYIFNNNLSESEEINPDLLICLHGVLWDINRLTPLSQIDYSEIKIKKYAAKIKQALARHIQGTEEHISFNCKITDIDTVVDNENNEYKSLQIEVFQKKNGKEQLRYKGILLNFYVAQENSLVNTPLLFCIAPKNIKKIVNNTIQELFNTIISLITIQENDLYWLTLLTDPRTGKKNECHFHYSVPALPKAVIEMTTRVSVLEKVWRSISRDDNEITIDQVESLKSLIADEFFNCFNLRVDRLNLNKIVLPTLTLYTDGRIKFHDHDKITNLIYFFLDETYFYFYKKIL